MIPLVRNKKMIRVSDYFLQKEKYRKDKAETTDISYLHRVGVNQGVRVGGIRSGDTLFTVYSCVCVCLCLQCWG